MGMSKAFSVKKSDFRKIPTTRMFALCLAILFVSPPVAFSQDTGETQNKKIDISADSLVVDNTKKYAEFSGNVKATQENTTIKSDRLVIYYREKSDKGDAAGENMIEKVVAEGNVVITFDGNVAETPKAEYTTADKLLVLSGPGSKIKGEKGLLSGSKITINRENGHTKVEGPVGATVFAGDKGIN